MIGSIHRKLRRWGATVLAIAGSLATVLPEVLPKLQGVNWTPLFGEHYGLIIGTSIPIAIALFSVWGDSRAPDEGF